MTRVDLVDEASASAASAPTLAQTQSAFVIVHNKFKAVANTPAALASLWASFGEFGYGRIGAKLGEQIAVTVADRSMGHSMTAVEAAVRGTIDT